MNWRKLFAEKPQPPVKKAKGYFMSYLNGSALFGGLFIALLLTINNTTVHEAIGLELYHMALTFFIGVMVVGMYALPAIQYGLQWRKLRKQA